MAITLKSQLHLHVCRLNVFFTPSIKSCNLHLQVIMELKKLIQVLPHIPVSCSSLLFAQNSTIITTRETVYLEDETAVNLRSGALFWVV